MVALIGAICGCVLGLLLYAGLANTGQMPLGGDDLMEPGRGFTPVLFAIYGAIIGGVLACVAVVWHSRRSMPNDRNRLL
jgi:hypothetical protein